MALKPEMSIMVGLATATMVYAVHQNATPTIADIRVGEPMDPDIESSERGASWASAALVSGVSLIAKDPTIFIIGGAAVILMAWMERHANMVDPQVSKAVPDVYGGRADQIDVGDTDPSEVE